MIIIPALVVAPAAQASHRWPTHAKVVTNSQYFERNQVPFFEVKIRAMDGHGKWIPGRATLWVNGEPERRRSLVWGWRGFRIDRDDLRDNRRNRIQVRIDPNSERRKIQVVTRFVVDRKPRPRPAPSVGQRVVDVAKRQVGDWYRFGADGPNHFDCSGLVVYSYLVAGGRRLPHSSYAIRSAGIRVARPRIGDVVWVLGHVAIYAGDGMVIEAAMPGTRVRLVPLWQRNPVYLRF